MTSNENPMNEQYVFDELLRNDRFDDSVGDQHRNDLRSEVLQSFGQPGHEASPVELRTSTTCEHQNDRWNRAVGYAVILAVCLIGFVAAWIYGGGGSDDRGIVVEPTIPEVTDESRLLASLAAVNSFRDEVSPEALFGAFAMCELDQEARDQLDAFQP